MDESFRHADLTSLRLIMTFVLEPDGRVLGWPMQDFRSGLDGWLCAVLRDHRLDFGGVADAVLSGIPLSQPGGKLDMVAEQLLSPFSIAIERGIQ